MSEQTNQVQISDAEKAVQDVVKNSSTVDWGRVIEALERILEIDQRKRNYE